MHSSKFPYSNIEISHSWTNIYFDWFLSQRSRRVPKYDRIYYHARRRQKNTLFPQIHTDGLSETLAKSFITTTCKTKKLAEAITFNQIIRLCLCYSNEDTLVLLTKVSSFRSQTFVCYQYECILATRTKVSQFWYRTNTQLNFSKGPSI